MFGSPFASAAEAGTSTGNVRPTWGASSDEADAAEARATGVRMRAASCVTVKVPWASVARNSACAGASMSVPSTVPTRGAAPTETTPSLRIDGRVRPAPRHTQVRAVNGDARAVHVDGERLAARDGDHGGLDGAAHERENHRGFRARDRRQCPVFENERRVPFALDRHASSRVNRVAGMQLRPSSEHGSVDERATVGAHDHAGDDPFGSTGERGRRLAHLSDGDREDDRDGQRTRERKPERSREPAREPCPLLATGAFDPVEEPFVD